MKDTIVLCGANSYEQKYYFNQDFKPLPQSVRDELQIVRALYTEDVDGVLTMEFDGEGNLEFGVISEEADYLFDEIGSVLKVKRYQEKKGNAGGTGTILQDIFPGRGHRYRG